MSMTVSSGSASARLKASESVSLFDQGNRLFGRLIDTYRSDVPSGLALAHLINVNPDLKEITPIARDRRRGFMKASATAAMDAEIAWKELDDPPTCAYVWGREINKDSLNLYTNNTSLFTTPSKDFWSTAYLKYILGDTLFTTLFNMRDTTQATVYSSILYAVNNLNRSLLGVPIITLKKTVLFDSQFVVELAKKSGTLSSTGFGLQPVLSRDAMMQVY